MAVVETLEVRIAVSCGEAVGLVDGDYLSYPAQAAITGKVAGALRRGPRGLRQSYDRHVKTRRRP